MSDPVDILRELVAIPSISRISNRPLIECAKRYLERARWAVDEYPYRDVAGVEKVNLIARSPRAEAAMSDPIDLAWFCHTDTVPFAESWTQATALHEEAGMLHGSGACDVKGSLACFLAAISRVNVKEISSRMALVLTADEEVGCVGAQHLLAASKLRVRRAIISEPTSLAVGVAGKGYGLAQVWIRAREAHSAFPEQGISAIRIAARMVDRMYGELPGAASARNPLFTPPQTTVNVGRIEGGTAKNILAGECKFTVEWRPVPEEDPAHIGRELQRLAQDCERAWTGCRIDVTVTRVEPGFAAAGGELARSLGQLLHARSTGISFSSEASRVAAVADEVVVVGPGDMRTAHSERECVPQDELERWTEAIGQLLATSS
ncbi:MAG: M20/M25/M40 family metallo-hydrolase [Acidobacteriaceae bacterium]